MSLLQTEAEKSNERTAIESRIKHSCKNLPSSKELDQGHKREAAKGKEVRQLEELDQAGDGQKVY